MDRRTRSNDSISTQFPAEWQNYYNTSQQAPRQVSLPQETYVEVGVPQQGSLTKATEPPSSPSTSQPTVIGSPGLESVLSTDDKEVYNRPGRPPARSPAHPSRKRIWGLPKKWFLVAAGLATCIIVALAVALGVVFGTRKSSYVALHQLMAVMHNADACFFLALMVRPWCQRTVHYPSQRQLVQCPISAIQTSMSAAH